ncbi:MAG TPA: hypothetical protein VKV28_17540 [Candidatus Binataceae bacterium]|nr:hypothetical protein [Candidatus Binataceae bacterium]
MAGAGHLVGRDLGLQFIGFGAFGTAESDASSNRGPDPDFHSHRVADLGRYINRYSHANRNAGCGLT